MHPAWTPGFHSVYPISETTSILADPGGHVSRMSPHPPTSPLPHVTAKGLGLEGFSDFPRVTWPTGHSPSPSPGLVPPAPVLWPLASSAAPWCLGAKAPAAHARAGPRGEKAGTAAELHGIKGCSILFFRTDTGRKSWHLAPAVDMKGALSSLTHSTPHWEGIKQMNL